MTQHDPALQADLRARLSAMRQGLETTAIFAANFDALALTHAAQLDTVPSAALGTIAGLVLGVATGIDLLGKAFRLVLAMQGIETRAKLMNERSRLFVEAGLVGSVESWRQLVDLRNALIHDYSDNPQRRLEAYCAARQAVIDLDGLFAGLNAYIARHAVLADAEDGS